MPPPPQATTMCPAEHASRIMRRWITRTGRGEATSLRQPRSRRVLADVPAQLVPTLLGFGPAQERTDRLVGHFRNRGSASSIDDLGHHGHDVALDLALAQLVEQTAAAGRSPDCLPSSRPARPAASPGRLCAGLLVLDQKIADLRAVPVGDHQAVVPLDECHQQLGDALGVALVFRDRCRSRPFWMNAWPPIATRTIGRSPLIFDHSFRLRCGQRSLARRIRPQEGPLAGGRTSESQS